MRMGYVPDPAPRKKGIGVVGALVIAFVGIGVLAVLGFAGMVALYAMSHGPPPAVQAVDAAYENDP